MLFYFHVRDFNGRISDPEGSELPDMDAARTEARASARDLAIEDLRCGQAVADRCIEIMEGGAVIESLMVHDVIRGHWASK
jgi:hypothetical protein